MIGNKIRLKLNYWIIILIYFELTLIIPLMYLTLNILSLYKIGL